MAIEAPSQNNAAPTAPVAAAPVSTNEVVTSNTNTAPIKEVVVEKAVEAPKDPMSEIPSILEQDKVKEENKDATETKTEDKKPEAQKTAPEKYEFKMPEGSTMPTETIDGYSKLAKEAGLPQDTAQKFIDYVASETKRMETAYKQDQMQQLKLADEALRKDPTLGGKNYDVTKANVQKAYTNLRKEMSPQGQQYWDSVLIQNRAANTLPYAELFNAVSKFYSEDRERLHDSTSPQPTEVTGFNLESVRRAFKIK